MFASLRATLLWKIPKKNAAWKMLNNLLATNSPCQSPCEFNYSSCHSRKVRPSATVAFNASQLPISNRAFAIYSHWTIWILLEFEIRFCFRFLMHLKSRSESIRKVEGWSDSCQSRMRSQSTTSKFAFSRSHHKMPTANFEHFNSWRTELRATNRLSG